MTTLPEIVAAVTFNDGMTFESVVDVPLFSGVVPLCVSLDDGCDQPSPRQYECLRPLLGVAADRMVEVERELFDHWSQYDHFHSDDAAYEYASPADARDAASLAFVYLPDDGVPERDWPQLHYAVDWDPEHGAQIHLVDGDFRWNPPRPE